MANAFIEKRSERERIWNVEKMTSIIQSFSEERKLETLQGIIVREGRVAVRTATLVILKPIEFLFNRTVTVIGFL